MYVCGDLVRTHQAGATGSPGVPIGGPLCRSACAKWCCSAPVFLLWTRLWGLAGLGSPGTGTGGLGTCGWSSQCVRVESVRVVIHPVNVRRGLPSRSVQQGGAWGTTASRGRPPDRVHELKGSHTQGPTRPRTITTTRACYRRSAPPLFHNLPSQTCGVVCGNLCSAEAHS